MMLLTVKHGSDTADPTLDHGVYWQTKTTTTTYDTCLGGVGSFDDALPLLVLAYMYITVHADSAYRRHKRIYRSRRQCLHADRAKGGWVVVVSTLPTTTRTKAATTTTRRQTATLFLVLLLLLPWSSPSSRNPALINNTREQRRQHQKKIKGHAHYYYCIRTRNLKPTIVLCHRCHRDGSMESISSGPVKTETTT